MSFGYERIGLDSPLFLKKSFLNGTPIHTHTRSHLYTLVPTFFSQIELVLRDLNFYSEEHLQKRANAPHLCKNKRKKKKKK